MLLLITRKQLHGDMNHAVEFTIPTVAGTVKSTSNLIVTKSEEHPLELRGCHPAPCSSETYPHFPSPMLPRTFEGSRPRRPICIASAALMPSFTPWMFVARSYFSAVAVFAARPYRSTM